VAGEQTEVVAVHDDRFEMTEVGGDIFERQHARIFDASASRDLYSAGRDVDCDHFSAAGLKLEGHTTRSAANVKHPSANETHALALGRRPTADGREVGGRAIVGIDKAVVAFDDLPHAGTPVVRQDQLSVSVFGSFEDHPVSPLATCSWSALDPNDGALGRATDRIEDGLDLADSHGVEVPQAWRIPRDRAVRLEPSDIGRDHILKAVRVIERLMGSEHSDPARTRAC
jgi:hypothetical protein